MPGSGALAAAAGPKGKGSGGAMQGRPLRCQAANMAADGRKVLGRDGTASHAPQGCAWESQGRNLAVLHPAGGAGSRENLLRTLPLFPTPPFERSRRALPIGILHRTLTIVQRYLFVGGTFLPSDLVAAACSAHACESSLILATLYDVTRPSLRTSFDCRLMTSCGKQSSKKYGRA